MTAARLQQCACSSNRQQRVAVIMTMRHPDCSMCQYWQCANMRVILTMWWLQSIVTRPAANWWHCSAAGVATHDAVHPWLWWSSLACSSRKRTHSGQEDKSPLPSRIRLCCNLSFYCCVMLFICVTRYRHNSTVSRDGDLMTLFDRS